MTDREKVIKGLYEAIEVIETHVPVRYIGYAEQACYDAIALLKEQEAVKPRANDASLSPFPICGACGTSLFAIRSYRPKYCSECGRKMKWDD